MPSISLIAGRPRPCYHMQVGGEQQLPQEVLALPPPARRSKTPTAQRSVFPAAAAAQPLSRTWDALTAEALSQVEHARQVQQQWETLKMRRHKQWKHEQSHTSAGPNSPGLMPMQEEQQHKVAAAGVVAARVATTTACRCTYTSAAAAAACNCS